MRLIGITILLLSLMQASFSLAQTVDSYTLNPGDEIQISVWREDSLDKTVIVLPDGHITFPLVGRINVSGLSSEGLESLIEKEISDYIPEAEVTVIINTVRGNSVHVIGKVVQPGEYVMHTRMTVAQVLSLAGGLNRFASEGGIKILRSENGSPVYYKFDYGDLVSGKTIESVSFILKAGDVVIVP